MEEAKITDPFQVILLGVIFDPAKRKILIGRREKDPHIKKLSWCFPGGHLIPGIDIDKRLKERIKLETGYTVKNLGVIFTKTYPEDSKLVSIYFLCEVFRGKEKPGDALGELKWVSPDEIEKHFKTSFHPNLKEYIMNLK
jgi:ADP-ribose pyrophosphatase YjhB (NUDIX family)